MIQVFSLARIIYFYLCYLDSAQDSAQEAKLREPSYYRQRFTSIQVFNWLEEIFSKKMQVLEQNFLEDWEFNELSDQLDRLWKP